jgi:4-amino-4-deoxy-L-arabinose transferase-like glycosyltransferase
MDLAMANDEGTSCRPLVLLAIIIAVVMFVLPLFVRFPLLDPDEGIHASIAQEMVERGDWLTPRLLGRPFFDKPILYFWCQAASLKLLGSNEAAVRLPGLMFGLLGAITTGLLAWRMFGRATGWIAGIFYATTILPTALAQAASHDVALVPSINLAILLLWEMNRAARLRTTVGCILGAGLFLGLSILTKGLVGVAVVAVAFGGCLVVTLSVYGQCRRHTPCAVRSSGRSQQQRRSRHTECAYYIGRRIVNAFIATRRILPMALLQGAVVLLVAALVAAPWYLAMASQHPGFLRYYFLDRHALGFATATQPHSNQPWWYYLPILLGGGLPWIGYVCWAGSKGLGMRDWGLENRSGAVNLQISKSPNLQISNPQSLIPNPSTLLWLWLIGWTVLLTLARSKLATYLWPAFPPVAILAGVAWTRLIDGSMSDSARRWFSQAFVGSSWGGMIVLPAAVGMVQSRYDLHFAWPVWVAVGLAAAISPLPLIAWRAGRRQAGLAAAALSMAVQFMAVMVFVLPPVAEEISARKLAEHFNRLGHLPSRLLLAEERIGSLVFYLDPQLRSGLKEGQLASLVADSPIRPQPGDVVAVRERRLANALEYLDLHHAPYESVGPYRLYRIGKPQATK